MNDVTDTPPVELDPEVQTQLFLLNRAGGAKPTSLAELEQQMYDYMQMEFAVLGAACSLKRLNRRYGMFARSYGLTAKGMVERLVRLKQVRILVYKDATLVAPEPAYSQYVQSFGNDIDSAMAYERGVIEKALDIKIKLSKR